MNCCTILIKIKDFIPKLPKIPYENFICIFTNDNFEGRISLMQNKYQYINHQIENIKSDLFYKITIIDIISNKIIGTSDHSIKYDIINNIDIGKSINFINQISIVPPRKIRQKISSNLNTYNNKFSLIISTEIIKFNKTPVNYIFKENSEFLKLNLNLSPNFPNKKIINITPIKKEDDNNINYILRKKVNTNLNFKKNNIKEIYNITYNNSKNDLNKGKNKNNINLNMHNITVQNYYTINSSSSALNLNSLKNNTIYIKKKFKQNKAYISRKNLANKSIRVERKKSLGNKKRKKMYNNNSYKEIKYSKLKNSISVDKIKINKNKFLNTSFKNNNNINKFISDKISKLEISSYNMFYNSNSFIHNKKCSNKLESIITPKNKNVRENSINSLSNDISTNSNLVSKIKYNESIKRIKSLKTLNIDNLKTNTNNYLNKKKNRYRKECKNNLISLLEYYNILNKKLKKFKESYNLQKSKYFMEKENLVNLIKKNNILKEKKYGEKIKRYIHVNINSKKNNQIISKMKIVKNKELNIFENIFNIFINKEDIIEQTYENKVLHENNNNKINLYLDLLKNIIKNYGNISQIYNNNLTKKYQLLHILINNGIEINNTKFLLKKKINNCKEIKEELNEDVEEESVIDKDKQPNEQKDSNISNNDLSENILDKTLINEFPIKFGNLTNKKFLKINSNEYLFNNEIKIFAFYNNGEVILKLEDNLNKKYSIDKFVSDYEKNKIEHNSENKTKNFSNLINSQKNKFKINTCWEKYSRNHKIIGERAFKGEFEKKLNNEKLLPDDNINKNDIIIKED